MRKKLLFFLIILFIYNLIYKLILQQYGQISKYIYNPIAWIFFTTAAYFIFDRGEHHHFKYKGAILRIIIICALFYNIIFYMGGLFVGYIKNPYDISAKGIIINIFSNIFVILMKEYIRSITINLKINRYSKFYDFLITLILIISDINLLSIIKANNPLFSIFGKDIISIINLNLFLYYLVKNGGYKASFLCRLIILLPNLLIGITPNYDWLVIILFSINFPFVAYLIIDYLIIKKNKEIPIRISKKYKPMHNVGLFVFIGLLIIFVLGFFPLKPLAVMSNSMSPYFDIGYIVLVEDINYDSIKTGDIVEYRNNQNIMIIHRVIQIYIDDGVKKMIFKGDNNENIDSKPVTEEQIIGRLKYRIPYIGYPSYLFKRIMGILIEKVLYGGTL